MLAIQCQIILWSLGYNISMNLVMPVLVGLLFQYCGFFLKKVEPDWFAGIRTPRALSSPVIALRIFSFQNDRDRKFPVSLRKKILPDFFVFQIPASPLHHHISSYPRPRAPSGIVRFRTPLIPVTGI